MQFSQQSSRTLISQRATYLLEPVESLGLILFRGGFGLLLSCHFIWELVSGAAHEKFIVPAFHFKYPGLGFVPVPSAPLLFALLCILVGALWCVAFNQICPIASLFAFGCTFWLLLIDSAYFLNHDYLHCLLCFLFFVTSCSRPLQPWYFGRSWSTTSPRWNICMFQSQFLIVYLFGALSKLKVDWLTGWPYRMFCHSNWKALVGMTACYVSLIFDFINGPLLILPRTKSHALWASLFFHLCQWFMLGGVSSLINVLSLLLFVDQQMLFEWFHSFFAGNWSRMLRFEKKDNFVRGKPIRAITVKKLVSRYPVVCFAGVFMLFQLLFPLQYLFVGNDATDRGRLFSWQGISRHKLSRGQYLCVDEVSFRRIDPALFLTRRQLRKMMGAPSMIHDFALHLELNVVTRYGLKSPSIYGRFESSLNGQHFASIVDANINLVEIGKRGSLFLSPISQPLNSAGLKELSFLSSSTLWLCVMVFVALVRLRGLRKLRDVAKRV